MTEVSLRGVIHSPKDAAEILRDLGLINQPSGSIGIIPYPLGPEDRILQSETIVSRIMGGMWYRCGVNTQQELNILAGYFWVEPRRLT